MGKKKPRIVNTAQPVKTQRREGYSAKVLPRSVGLIRTDIGMYTAALQQALNAVFPRRVRLNYIYREVKRDATLSSQIENRRLQLLATPFVIKDAAGEVDEVSTQLLRQSKWNSDLIGHIWDTTLEGPCLLEFLNDDVFGFRVQLINRNNIIPERGIFTKDETGMEGIKYREVNEYGTWLLEFGDPYDLGILNKAVPHALFKRFAQSCWSELCEIYGIPPRVMKTNTQDPSMLARGEQMMRDMGAAAWFIIDETESFEFAKGVDTNGDVYKQLVTLCNNEMSMLISGAIVGQDTQHGTRGKEKQSSEITDRIFAADKRLVELAYAHTVLPALYRMGMIPEGRTLEYQPQENVEKLWGMTKDALPYFKVDLAWVKDKFGLEVTGERVSTPATGAGPSGSEGDDESTDEEKKLAADRFFV